MNAAGRTGGGLPLVGSPHNESESEDPDAPSVRRNARTVGHDGAMTTPFERPSARVIVIDETGCVLLFRIEDSHDPKPPLWITPGGGIKSDETPEEAAAREFAEETGVVVHPAELGNPVATCRASGPSAASICIRSIPSLRYARTGLSLRQPDGSHSSASSTRPGDGGGSKRSTPRTNASCLPSWAM